jgi:hypothetical protein
MSNCCLKCPNLEVGKLKYAFYLVTICPLYSIMKCTGFGQNAS